MSIRIATRADIPELQIIRSSVTQNVLTSIITEEMIIDVMEKYGRIWIYDLEGQAVGFSAADKRTSNIWALLSYRPGKNEASANGYYMKQFSGFGSMAPGPFGRPPNHTHGLKNSISDRGGRDVESGLMVRSGKSL